MDFCRKLPLTEALHCYNVEDGSKAKNRSEYFLTKGINKAFEYFCEDVTNFPFNVLQEQRIKSNFDTNEGENFIELKNNINLTIKEADKGKCSNSDRYRVLIKNQYSPCWKAILTVRRQNDIILLTSNIWKEPH